jgi:hypothetical protein
VVAPGADGVDGDEPGLGEDLEVLRHGRLTDRDSGGQFTHGQGEPAAARALTIRSRVGSPRARNQDAYCAAVTASRESIVGRR